MVDGGLVAPQLPPNMVRGDGRGEGRWPATAAEVAVVVDARLGAALALLRRAVAAPGLELPGGLSDEDKDDDDDAEGRAGTDGGRRRR
jgi:hypothetical protein